MPVVCIQACAAAATKVEEKEQQLQEAEVMTMQTHKIMHPQSQHMPVRGVTKGDWGGGWQDARLAAECRWQAVESEAGKQAKVRQHEQEQLQGAREKVMLR